MSQLLPWRLRDPTNSAHIIAPGGEIQGLSVPSAYRPVKVLRRISTLTEENPSFGSSYFTPILDAMRSLMLAPSALLFLLSSAGIESASAQILYVPGGGVNNLPAIVDPASKSIVGFLQSGGY